MVQLTGLAYAKINLTLDVTGKRNDGYHLIRSVMQSVSLADEIKIYKTDRSGIKIICSDPSIPCNESNTVHKACVEFFDFTDTKKCGLAININKRIPSQAGLGGGSSDAATVIKLLDKLFETNLSEQQMMEIGAKVGADVPFCIASGTAMCEGTGEIVTPLFPIKKHYVLLIKPNFGISTPLAYRLFDEKEIKSAKATDKMIEAINERRDITKLLANDLESAIENEEIGRIKAKLIESGSLGSLMSGSGSCVYGLFTDKESAFTAYNTLKDNYAFVYLAETV